MIRKNKTGACWLDTIIKEMRRIDPKDIIEPDYEFEPEKEEEVATLDLKHRRLLTLARIYSKEIKEITQLLESEEATLDYEKTDLLGVLYQLEQKIVILREIFWISLRDAYNLWEADSIGIKRGWKLVLPKPKPKSDLPVPSLSPFEEGVFRNSGAKIAEC